MCTERINLNQCTTNQSIWSIDQTRWNDCRLFGTKKVIFIEEKKYRHVRHPISREKEFDTFVNCDSNRRRKQQQQQQNTITITNKSNDNPKSGNRKRSSSERRRSWERKKKMKKSTRVRSLARSLIIMFTCIQKRSLESIIYLRFTGTCVCMHAFALSLSFLLTHKHCNANTFTRYVKSICWARSSCSFYNYNNFIAQSRFLEKRGLMCVHIYVVCSLCIQ